MSRLGLPCRFRSLLALSLVLSACVAVPVGSSIQHGPAGPSYLFLSSNTDDHLTLVEASRRLASPVQLRYHRVAGDILQRLGVKDAKVHDAVGDWGDSCNARSA